VTIQDCQTAKHTLAAADAAVTIMAHTDLSDAEITAKMVTRFIQQTFPLQISRSFSSSGITQNRPMVIT
jgi:hypothetical protein